MVKPLVSVLISAYNAEKYIDECINSIINQSYKHIEIIVVNDGSTDNTSNVIEKYRSRIIQLYQNNMGQCAALNKAFEYSKGDFIKFFDSDDILNREHIELQINRLLDKPNFIASAEWGRFYMDELTTFKINRESVWKDMNPIDWIIESLRNGTNMMQCGLWLIPRTVLEKSGLWDIRLTLNNDIEFFTRVLLESEGVLHTQGAVLFYRSGISGSLSSVINRKSLEAALLSNKLAVEYVLSIENSKRARLACANVLQTWAYQTYPLDSDLTSELESIIKNLGGSDILLPGGIVKKILSQLIGWKLTKKIHASWERIRYNS